MLYNGARDGATNPPYPQGATRRPCFSPTVNAPSSLGAGHPMQLAKRPRLDRDQVTPALPARVMPRSRRPDWGYLAHILGIVSMMGMLFVVQPSTLISAFDGVFSYGNVVQKLRWQPP